MCDYSRPADCMQHYSPLVRTDCYNHLGCTGDSYNFDWSSSSGIELGHTLLHTVGNFDLAERLALLAGMNLHWDGKYLIVIVIVRCCSNWSAESAVRGYPPARQGRLPKSWGPTWLRAQGLSRVWSWAVCCEEVVCVERWGLTSNLSRVDFPKCAVLQLVRESLLSKSMTNECSRITSRTQRCVQYNIKWPSPLFLQLLWLKVVPVGRHKVLVCCVGS